jgi:hypothetical protein
VFLCPPLLRSAQHDDGDLSSRKILLVPDILIGGNKDLELRLLRRRESFTVAQRVPTDRGQFGEPGRPMCLREAVC